MKISDLNISLVNHSAGLVGFANFVLDETLYVSGIAIHEKRDGSGYRLTYPTRRSGEQVFNLFHPVNRQASKAIEHAIFRNLKNVLNQGCNNVGHDRDKSPAL